MGLGSFGGGLGVAEFLVQQGAHVTVTDLCPEEKLTESIERLADLPITWHLGGHVDADFTQANTDVVVVNPAVKPTNKYLKNAQQEKLQLTSEMNIFFDLCPAPIVGITGSNGKSTTASMTAAVLQAGANEKARSKYRKVWLGGNIGQENLLCHIDRIQRPNQTQSAPRDPDQHRSQPPGLARYDGRIRQSQTEHRAVSNSERLCDSESP